MPVYPVDPLDDKSQADATSDLLERARAGDQQALNQLLERHVPLLKRWASGRLPRWARDIADTSDLVQETIIQTLKHLDRFEHRGDGALQAYLRQAVINRIRNELRRAAAQSRPVELDPHLPDKQTSPLERAIGEETLDWYEAALKRLTDEQREAVITRVEFGLSYAEIARALGKPSPDAARMLVVRGLTKLARERDADS
jgi:RNA polymerase sigma factor (sigma-70 family)